jgi:hypothetical protein
LIPGFSLQRRLDDALAAKSVNYGSYKVVASAPAAVSTKKSSASSSSRAKSVSQTENGKVLLQSECYSFLPKAERNFLSLLIPGFSLQGNQQRRLDDALAAKSVNYVTKKKSPASSSSPAQLSVSQADYSKVVLQIVLQSAITLADPQARENIHSSSFNKKKTLSDSTCMDVGSSN